MIWQHLPNINRSNSRATVQMTGVLMQYRHEKVAPTITDLQSGCLSITQISCLFLVKRQAQDFHNVHGLQDMFGDEFQFVSIKKKLKSHPRLWSPRPLCFLPGISGSAHARSTAYLEEERPEQSCPFRPWPFGCPPNCSEASSPYLSRPSDAKPATAKALALSPSVRIKVQSFKALRLSASCRVQIAHRDPMSSYFQIYEFLYAGSNI